MRTDRLQSYEKYFHIGVWGIPLPFIAAMLGKHDAEFDQGGMGFCTAKIDPTKNFSNDLALFYIPVALILAGTMVLFLWVILKLVTFRVVHKGSQVNTFKAQRHLIIGILIVTIIFALIFGLRFSVNVKKLNNDTTAWVTCKAIYELGLASDDECSTNTNPNREAFGKVIMQNFAVASVGFWVFLGCGRQKKIYRMWGIILGHLARGEFGDMWTYIKYGEKRRKRTLSSEKTHSKSSQSEKPEKKQEEKVQVGDNEIVINDEQPTSTSLDASSFISDADISNVELGETPRNDSEILKSDVESGVRFDDQVD